MEWLKKGAKVPRKGTSPVGTWHHASDWVLLVDYNSNCLPVPIAFTQLRTDITMLSNHLKKIILINYYVFVKKIVNPAMALRSTST